MDADDCLGVISVPLRRLPLAILRMPARLFELDLGPKCCPDPPGEQAETIPAAKDTKYALVTRKEGGDVAL
jgi:hypothetical protein